jgi:hypothetical protein
MLVRFPASDPGFNSYFSMLFGSRVNKGLRSTAITDQIATQVGAGSTAVFWRCRMRTGRGTGLPRPVTYS